MSTTQPAGALTIARAPVRSVADAYAQGAGAVDRYSRSPMGRFQAANAGHFARSLRDQAAFDRGHLFAIGHLWLAKIGRGGLLVDDLGLASCRVVTNAGVAYIVDAFQNLTELENMRFHGVGTGSTAEAASNTALATELTSQYATNGTRVTGTAGEQSGVTNVFETTATITVSSAVAITEHGIFSTSAANTGVLLDRSVFAAINLGVGESLQATYALTLPSGG